MKRRFVITMYQKGQLYRIGSEYKDFLSFEKMPKHQNQILCFDEDRIIEKYKSEGNIFTFSPLNILYRILGIDKNNPNRLWCSLSEIKENVPMEYCNINISYITKESKKAYYIRELNKWIPKSQSYIENDMLYIKRWLFK